MKYTCIRCGKQFEARHKTAVCQDCHTAVCAVCGKEFQLQTPWTQKTCSPKCRGIYRKVSGIAAQVTEKAQKTRLKRYGTADLNDLQVFHRKCKWCGKEFTTTHARQVYCNDIHYGECPVCGNRVKIKEMYLGPQACSEKCRMIRINATCMERYGNKDAVNSEHAIQLRKAKMLERYGVDHYSKTDEYKQKYTNTMMSRYGAVSPLKCPEVLNKVESTCMKKYGVPFSCMTPQCRNSYRTVSKVNEAFSELLASCNIEHDMEYPIGRKSYDFKVGWALIEIDPSITHNSAVSIFPDSAPMSTSYHLEKSKLAESNGYRCIHVWDWDNWDAIVSLVSPKKRIYARKCEVVKIPKKEADEFTANNHIAGKCNGQNIAYGLMYQNELVEVMTFGKPRYNKKYDWELLRLCSKSGLVIVGGVSKLFAKYLDDYKDNSVISYCDLSKFSGTVYTKIGMSLVHITPPAKVWSKGNKKITDNLLRQRGYDQLFGTNFGKGTSNEQLMLDNGWLPVYDCGQAVYEYRPGQLTC